jgi:protocatechuate 3,4-dioxygenase beta subunit
MSKRRILVSRRGAIQTLGLGLATAPLLKLLGACTSDGGLSADGGQPGSPDAAPGTPDGAPGTPDGAPGSPDAAPGACDGVATTWASGGTASMTAKACYPDPFATAVASCTLICQTTAGPCTSTTMERVDVSEGFPGLPVRLGIKVVEADGCTPVANAKVEIWHTQRTGVYSGVTPSGMMCYGNDPSAVNHLYFRGSQHTDAGGVVYFDTCFPGWYPGRAIHIHFRVYESDTLYATSQLFFDTALETEIFSSHPDYQEFGQPNTSNARDGIIRGVADLTPYVLDTQRMPDGAMLASKVVAIRASTSDPTCSTSGGPGGP